MVVALGEHGAVGHHVEVAALEGSQHPAPLDDVLASPHHPGVHAGRGVGVGGDRRHVDGRAEHDGSPATGVFQPGRHDVAWSIGSFECIPESAVLVVAPRLLHRVEVDGELNLYPSKVREVVGLDAPGDVVGEDDLLEQVIQPDLVAAVGSRRHPEQERAAFRVVSRAAPEGVEHLAVGRGGSVVALVDHDGAEGHLEVTESEVVEPAGYGKGLDRGDHHVVP